MERVKDWVDRKNLIDETHGQEGVQKNFLFFVAEERSVHDTY
jgi:hypothetical protein